MNQDPKARGLIYAARMRYLKSREGRKSGVQLDTNDDNLYFTKREQCDPKVLTPPPEVETRTHAFKQAYWRYHAKPVIESIEIVFSPAKEKVVKDENKERLKKKRKDILAKVRSREAQHRAELTTRRRVELAVSGDSNSGIELNGNSNSGGVESDESGDEHESTVEEKLGQISLHSPSLPIQPRKEDPAMIGGRTETKSSTSVDSTSKISTDAKTNHRSSIQSGVKTAHPAEERARQNSSHRKGGNLASKSIG